MNLKCLKFKLALYLFFYRASQESNYQCFASNVSYYLCYRSTNWIIKICQIAVSLFLFYCQRAAHTLYLSLFFCCFLLRSMNLKHYSKISEKKNRLSWHIQNRLKIINKEKAAQKSLTSWVCPWASLFYSILLFAVSYTWAEENSPANKCRSHSLQETKDCSVKI